MKKLLNTITILAVASLALVGCDGGPGPTPTPPAGKPDKVRFAMDWTPNTNHTGIYVAIDKGWYRDANLEVELLPYSDANTPDTLVATGQADLGVSFAESVVVDHVEGLPVKSVAAILQTNTSALVTLKSSGLDTVGKLNGKRYAGFGTPYEEPIIKTMIKHDGVENAAFENITANLFGYSAIVAKQADFVWIYMGWEGIQAELEGVELNTFMLKEYGIPDYYTPVIIANDTFLKDHGDVAKRFLEATARGYEFGVTNPIEAADSLIKAAPAGTFSDPELPRKSQAYLAPFFKADQPKWGLQSIQKWTDFPTYLANTGLLKSSDGRVIKPEDLKFEEMFTNDFLPR
jgi:ABC-type nitrate/sulfonate/bicarbonate transport system substrate-binding protein